MVSSNKSLDLNEQKLPETSLPNAILKILETDILNHRYQPGEKINENKLAEELNVSRIPLREAIRKLEQAGLVEIIPNRGVFVRELQWQEVVDLYNIRIAMDELAGRLIVEVINEFELEILQKYINEMGEILATGEVEDFHSVNIVFHDALFEFTHNERLASINKTLDRELRLFRHEEPDNLIDDEEERRSFNKGANHQHQLIVNAIEVKDGDLASRLLKEHAISVKKFEEKYMQRIALRHRL